jgi:predicted nicotinamide N-methyase
MSTPPTADPRAFIAANTRILSAPHVPEIALHLADDAVALWEMTEEELGRIGLPPPFWAFAWAGGQALARYLLDTPETAAGRAVLDVAAGCGIAAIAAMKAGARAATAVDIDAFAAQAVTLNAALNQVEIMSCTDDPIGMPTDADLILIGDLFYERDLAARVLAWVEALHAQGKAILVGDPGRTYFPKERFRAVATYAVPVTRALEDAEIKRTSVWQFNA